MILVSNKHLNGLSRIQETEWFYTGDPSSLKSYFDGGLFFEGFFYDREATADQLIPTLKTGSANILLNQLCGEYCAFFLDKDKKSVNIYSSLTGANTLYVWSKDGHLVITDSVASLLYKLNLGLDDLDIQAIEEYYVFGYTVAENTFLKNLKRVRSGCLITYSDTKISCLKVFDYHLSGIYEGGQDEFIEEMDSIFRQAVNRCINRYGEGSTYCLALSNGLDSRLTAHYFKDTGIKLFGYFFGERNSQEALAATKIADNVGIKLITCENYRNFFEFFNEYTDNRPFADLEWCKYLPAKKILPEYNLILSGFLGNHLFGGWEFSYSNKKIHDDEMAIELVKKFSRVELSQDMLNSLTERVSAVLQENCHNSLSKKTEFWFRSVIQFEKECDFFTDINGKPHYSIFCDLDVVRLALKLQYRQYPFRLMYHKFLEKKFFYIHPQNIPAIQIKNSHKPIEKWLAGNSHFIEKVRPYKKQLELAATLYNKKIDVLKYMENIYEGHLSRNELHLFFRYLTVALFIMKHIEKSGGEIYEDRDLL